MIIRHYIQPTYGYHVFQFGRFCFRIGRFQNAKLTIYPFTTGIARGLAVWILGLFLQIDWFLEANPD